ncbi:MAG: PKD domain-containing protein [Bacteroidia bacterium]
MIRLGIDTSGNTISGPYNIKGIFVAHSNASNYYNNSIYLAGSSAGTTNTACIDFNVTVLTTDVVNVKNNIFYNNISNSSSGRNACMRMITNNGRIFSNFNIFYAPNTNGAVGLISGTPYTALTGSGGWNSATLTDGQSASVDPNFNAPNGSVAMVDLHLGSSNPAEGNGDPTVTTITDDYDGQLRASFTPNDIGADAAAFTLANDKCPPIINLMPLTNTSSTSNRTFTVNIVDNGTGMPLTTANQPRVYYKKGTGTVYNATGSLTSGTRQNGVWTFTMDYSSFSGVTTGDIISYYILAQDSAGNVVSNAMYAVASSVSSVSSDPATPNTYTIVASLSTTIDVGSGQTYTSLTETGAAGLFEAINNSGLQGNTVINITSDLTETGAVALNQWNETGSGGYTLTIRPSAASRRVISGTNSTTNGLIRLNGADRVTFTGIPSGGASTDTFMVIRGTSTSVSVLTMMADATFNTFQNCIIEGASASTVTGAVLISPTSNLTTGNDNNSFIGSHIRGIGTTLAVGIYSQGQSPTGILPLILQDNITIRECHIYNWTNNGISVSGTGNGNNWRILNNHFYRTYTPVTVLQVSINFVPGLSSNNDTISGNFIGGMAANCGGSAWSSASTVSGSVGILVNAGTEAGTQVQGNTIQNFLFSQTTTSIAASTPQFIGINITGGVVNVGGITGNTIGDAATPNSIQTNSDASLVGINSFTGFTLTVNNNKISNLTAKGSTVYTNTAVRGIMISSGTLTLNVRDNTVQNLNAVSRLTGSTTSAAVVGIGVSSSGNVQNVLNNTVQNLFNYDNIGAHCMVGLYVTSGVTMVKNNVVKNLVSSTASTTTVSTATGILGMVFSLLGNSEVMNNTISNIQYVSTTPTSTQLVGMYISSGSGIKVRNNTIFSLNSMTISTGTLYSAGLIGMSYSAGGTFLDFTGNTIHSLNHTNSATANPVHVIGFVSLAASSVTPYYVARNNIHSLKLSTTGNGTMIGIANYGYSGTFENNMVRVGIDSSGNAFSGPYNVYGIQQTLSNLTSVFYYHNSVYVGGAPSSGASVTAAFHLPLTFSTTTTRAVIKNNIFQNSVSNTGSATGKNCAMQLNATSLTFSDNNILYANGTGGLAVNVMSTFTDYANLSGANSWQSATGLDLRSGSGDPGFVNATGNAGAVDLHLSSSNPAEGNGAMDVPTTVDFDGNLRSGRSPADIGATSGNYTLSSDIIAPVITFNLLNNASTTSGSRTVSNVSITDNVGIPMTGGNIPRIYFSKNGTTWKSTAATSLTGSANNAVATFGIDYSAIGGVATGDTIRYYVIAQDNSGNLRSNGLYAVASDVNTITTNPLMPLTYKLVPALAAGTKLRVGIGKTYPTLTGAGGLFEYLNTVSLGGDVTAVISSNTTEPGTFALNQLGDNDGGTYTLTIRPDSLTSTERLISGNVSSMIRLDGADRVKFTGIPDFNGSSTDKKLRFRNSNTAGQVFLFVNEATNNRLHNINIEGANASVTSGLVQFSTSTKMFGNSWDTISNCVIGHDPTGIFPLGVPAIDIYSLGDAGKENHANVIMNNEITNFTQYGVWLTTVGNGNNWNITGNSFYRSLSFPAFALQYAIFMDVQIHSGGHNINNNYIGGSAKNCGGAPWVNNANVDLRGISFTTGSILNPTNIKGNIIQNIRKTNIGTSSLFSGIIVQGGVSANIENNLVGHPSDINSIVLSGAGQQNGISPQSTGTYTLIGNTVQGINLNTSGVGSTFVGLFPSNGMGTIRNNLVGSTTVANSIQHAGTASCIGIQTQMTSLNAPTVLVDGNTVANMTSTGMESGIIMRGYLHTGTAIPTITNNTVFNLSTNASNLAIIPPTAVNGMGISGSTWGGTLSNNTVYNIRALNTGAVASVATGIGLTTANNVIISNNRVYDIINMSTNTNISAPAVAVGISISSPQNVVTVQNNQISLGTGQTNSPMYIGIWQSASGNFQVNSYFNSVYIGGTATSGLHNSFGYMRGNNLFNTGFTSITNAKNNLLMNDRKGGAGKHYAIANQSVIASFQTGWLNNASNYNLLSNATGNPIGWWNISDYNYNDWKSVSNNDLNSVSYVSGTGGGQINPDMFMNRAVADLNLDVTKSGTALIINKATPISGISADFVNKMRSTTAPTIGSFEVFSNDAGVTAVTSPTNTTCASTATQVTVTIKNFGIVSLSNIPVTLKVTGTTTLTSNQSFAGPLAAGASASYTFPDNINTVTGATLNFKAYTNLSGDENRSNDSSASTVTIVPKPTPVAAGTNPICEKSTATYSTTLKTGMNYSWTIVGGTILSGQNTNSISVKWGSVGTASVSVTETIAALSCAGSNTLNVTLNPLPKPNFTYTDTCGGKTVAFTSTSAVAGGTITGNSWKFGDGGSATGNTASRTYATTGASYSVQITSTSNNGCVDSASKAIFILKTLSAGVISNNQTICYNTAPALITTSTGASGSIAPYTNQWQVSTDNVNFSNISGATGQDYQPGSLTATTYYRRSTNTAVCGPAVSNTVTITVGTLLNPGAIASGQTVCPGGTGSAIGFTTTPSGSVGSYTFQWQSSPDSSTWSNVTGQTANTFTPTNVTSVIYYRNLIFSGSCPSAGTNGVKIKLYSPIAGGSIAAGQTICAGTAPASFTSVTAPTGGPGTYTFQWQSSNDSINWNNISGATSATYTSGAIGSLTYFQRLAGSTGCPNGTSNALKVRTFPKPTVSFTASNHCFNDAMPLSNSSSISSGSITYLWKFGDGTTSTSSVPNKTYASSGTYNVNLIVTSNIGCKDSLVKSVIVATTPSPSFTFTLKCQGDSAIFTDNTVYACGAGSGLVYHWNFGDGTTSNVQHARHHYNSAGTYNVKFKISLPGGFKDSIIKTVSFNIRSTPGFTATNECFPATTSFTNSSSGFASLAWSFGDGTTSTTTSSSFTKTYTTAGTYNAKVVSTSSFGCKDSVIKAVNVFSKPKATFTTANNCVGLTTSFNNSSSGAVSYAWNFGDGRTSTSVNPSNTYASAGTYTVSLTVTSSNGCVDATSSTVTIHPNPVPNFTTADVCFGFVSSFSNSSTGASTYSWNFGNGNSSSATNPTYTYPVSGSYTVTLTATTTNGCSQSTAKSYTVNSAPKAAFTGSNVCLGLGITFNNSSTGATTNSWNFGDATTSAAASPSKTYSAAGNYNVKLLVATAFGCKDSVTKTVTIFAKPVPAFTANNQCLGTVVSFTNQSTGAAQTVWNFGDGKSSAANSPDYNYAVAGTYTVKLLVISVNGCRDSLTKTVTVHPRPIVSFSASPNPICRGGLMTFTNTTVNGATYKWDFGNGTSSTSTSPTNIFNTHGNYVVKLVSTSTNGCKDSAYGTITVWPRPVASFKVNDGCTGDNLYFGTNSVGAVSHEWTFGDGNSSTSTNPSKGYTNPGSYSVKLIVTSINGCKDTTSSTVTVNPRATVSFTNPSNFCVGLSTTFTNTSTLSSGNMTHQWKFGDGNTSSATNPTNMYGAGGNYIVSLTTTTDKGCVNTNTSSILVYGKPTANFNANGVCAGGTVTFNNTTTGGSTYIWDFGDASTSTSTSPTHTYTAAGTYNVKLTANNANSCMDVITKQVIVFPNPTANFTVTDRCIGQTLAFTNTSAGANDVTWQFGDGNSSNSYNPSYTYTNSGTYNVTLNVKSVNGCVNSVSKSVTVFSGPKVGFSINDNGQCINSNTFVYTDNSTVSTGTITRAWNLGDGSTSTATNPSRTYASSGNYNVKLVVTSSNGCKDSAMSSVMVFPKPTANFTINNVAQCFKGHGFSFSDASTISSGSMNRVWNLGDGTTIGGSNAIKSYLSPGTYIIRLTVSSDLGCVDSTSQSVTVNPSPVASFDFNDQVQCLNGNVFNFTNTTQGATVYNSVWNLGDGFIINTANASRSYAAVNIYKVRLNVTTPSGCKDSVYYNMTVMANPAALIISGPNQALVGSTQVYSVTATPGSSYNWVAVNGTVLSNGANRIQVKWNSTGASGTLTVTETGANECKSNPANYNVAFTVGVNQIFRNAFAATLYPNPAKDNFTVEVATGDMVSMSIYDEVGREVMSGQRFNKSITITEHQLAAGIYAVRLTTDKGKTTILRFEVIN